MGGWYSRRHPRTDILRANAHLANTHTYATNTFLTTTYRTNAYLTNPYLTNIGRPCRFSDIATARRKHILYAGIERHRSQNAPPTLFGCVHQHGSIGCYSGRFIETRLRQLRQSTSQQIERSDVKNPRFAVNHGQRTPIWRQTRARVVITYEC